LLIVRLFIWYHTLAFAGRAYYHVCEFGENSSYFRPAPLVPASQALDFIFLVQLAALGIGVGCGVRNYEVLVVTAAAGAYPLCFGRLEWR
jgi:hypothetical protein